MTESIETFSKIVEQAPLADRLQDLGSKIKSAIEGVNEAEVYGTNSSSREISIDEYNKIVLIHRMSATNDKVPEVLIQHFRAPADSASLYSAVLRWPLESPNQTTLTVVDPPHPRYLADFERIITHDEDSQLAGFLVDKANFALEQIRNNQ